MNKRGMIPLFTVTMMVLLFNSSVIGCGFEEYRKIEYDKEMVSAMKAVFKARQDLGLEKGDEKLLALTNAGYGSINGASTEPFLDIISNVTACTMGTKSLLMVHTPEMDPLWCALNRKDNGNVVFMKWTGEQFEQRNYNIASDKILNPPVRKEQSDDFIGQYFFPIVSICNCWAAGISWPMLKSAEFHGHICPGLNVGAIAYEDLKENQPLRGGEQYVFICSPTNCPADALQVLCDSTAGKALTFSTAMKKEDVAKYSGDLWFKGCPIPPLVTISLRVNKEGNSCEGVVLAIGWKTLFHDVGLSAESFSSPGGKSNPMYFISRTKLSLQLASMPMAKKMTYMKELKTFFGQASTVQTLSKNGADPYAIIWNI
ncbi:MAG: FmdE family protein [Thermodesulfobacteriota bacterium]|nr:FmdE family protein [Thermodesulfobacteriota bacterium]